MASDRTYRLFAVLLLVVLATLAPAATYAAARVASFDRDQMALGPYLQVHVDPTRKQSIDAVRALAASQWTDVTVDYPSFGFSPHAYWFRFEIVNPRPTAEMAIVELAFALHDQVEFYHFRETGRVEQLNRRGPRDNVHRNFVFPLELQPGESDAIYVKVLSSASIQIPLILWQRAAFYENEHRGLVFHSMYFGAALLLIFYNAVLFIGFRSWRYLLYVGAVSGVVLAQLAFTGIGQLFLWPDHSGWNQTVLFIAGPVTLISYFLFLKSVLELHVIHAWLNRLAWLVIAFAALFLAQNWFYGITARSVALAAMVVGSSLIAMVISYAAWYVTRKRYVASVAIASTAYMLSLIYLGADGLNLLPIGRLSEYAVPLGSGIEMFLLSYALIQQWRDISLQKIAAEHRLAETSERLLGLEREQSAKLEAQVQQRTRDLEQRTQDLSEALTSVEALNKQLAELNITDQLTGAKNRRYFDERLDQEIVRAQRSRKAISLILMDLDHFKKVNDTYGHQGGDDCLRQVVQRISGQVRPCSDAVCRYGGEELAIILPETSLTDAEHVAERIRQSVEAIEIVSGAHRFRVTASLGVTGRVPDQGDVAQSWLKMADAALYVAKRGGRNQVVCQSLD